jgi:ABC-type uncharacterized transport system auxiliary subunit
MKPVPESMRPASTLPGRSPRLPWITALIFILLAPLLVGCGKPPILVQRYILEYPPPVVGPKTKIPEALKVGQFSVAQAFNTNAMVYQPQPFKSEVYNYSRWRVNPGYLVTDYLLRDFRDAGLFNAVFGPNSNGRYRFLLEGGVEDFQEVDEPDGWKAALTLTVTLLDVTREELPQRVVFQKTYQALEPMPEKTPGGLAQAMSRALEQVSARILTDTYGAARRRSAGK